MKSERQYDYNNGIATIRSERTWDRNQSRVVDLVQFANGSQGLDASIDANGGGQYLAPGYRYHIIVEKTLEMSLSNKSNSDLHWC